MILSTQIILALILIMWALGVAGYWLVNGDLSDNRGDIIGVLVDSSTFVGGIAGVDLVWHSTATAQIRIAALVGSIIIGSYGILDYKELLEES